MTARGLVASVTDETGRLAFAPVARAEHAFAARVASLFVADFLAHPSDYAGITACSSCGEMELAGSPRHTRACVRRAGSRPRMQSGVCYRQVGQAAPEARTGGSARGP
jgi:hypothetical protein